MCLSRSPFQSTALLSEKYSKKILYIVLVDWRLYTWYTYWWLEADANNQFENILIIV